MAAHQERSRRDPCVLVNVKLTNFLILAETATLVDQTRSSPADNVSAKLDILSTIVEFVLLHADQDNSPSKEDVPSVP